MVRGAGARRAPDGSSGALRTHNAPNVPSSHASNPLHLTDLQRKLDEMQSTIRQRSGSSTGVTAGAEGTGAKSARPRRSSKDSNGLVAPRRAISRGGSSLQWQGTRSYLEERRYNA